VSDVGQLVAERYRLTQHIGSGAMGVVWQAHDERLHRTVALKQLLLSPSFSAADTKEATERAMREGRIAARLQHPNAVSVYDVVDDNGQPVLVMEYVPSRSLSAVLDERTTLDPLEVARIGSQIATALTAAHTAGIVHRDIKPGNVLLADDGIVKITDFGISRATGDVTVTATGMLAGTPAYLAPEVAKGENPGPPSDVFSLASTLYTAVEGYPPFGHSDNTLALLHAVAACRTIPPKQAGPLTGLLSQMLRPNPEERPTMAETSRALSALAAGQAPSTGSNPRLETPASPPRGSTFEEGATTRIPRPPQLGPGSGGFAAPPVRPSDQTVNLNSGAFPSAGPTQLQRPAYPQTGPNPALPGGYPQTGPNLTQSDQGPLPWKKWLVTAGAIIAAAVVGILVANAFVNTNPSSAPPTPSLVAQPSSTGAAPTTQSAPSSQTQAANESNQDNQGDNGGANNAAAAMKNTLQSYYALLPSNPAQAWQLLSGSAQQANGGYANYQKSWQGIAATQVSNISAAGGSSMNAKVTFVRADGQSATNQIRFDFVQQNGQILLNNATVVQSGKPDNHHNN
jgi:hypothetical protein